MQRRQFLSTVAGGVAGGLPLTARGDALEAPARRTRGSRDVSAGTRIGTPLFTLTLADGREIHAASLVACRTYTGLLAGVPNEEINERELSELKEMCHRALLVQDSIIIPPAMTAYESHDLRWNEYPPVFISARFISLQDPDGSINFSTLAVGWFQTSLQPLIADDILAAIKQLDWANLARDFVF